MQASFAFIKLEKKEAGNSKRFEAERQTLQKRTNENLGGSARSHSVLVASSERKGSLAQATSREKFFRDVKIGNWQGKITKGKEH
jgi:hypothetical protein